MKRRIRFIFGTLSLLACAFILPCFIGCNASDPGDGKVEYDNKYEWEYDREFEGEYDEYMNIDGVLDEDVWNVAERKWLTISENDATVSFTTCFTERGLYIASVAQDPNLCWNARFNFNDNPLNSAFFYYITSVDTDNLQMFTKFRFAFDSKNKVSYEQTPFAAKAVTDKDIDSGEASRMTGEFFATWDDLNIQVNEETGKPDAVNIIPMYRTVKDSEDSTVNKWVQPLFSDNTRLHCYCLFYEDGYVNEGAGSSIWGNAYNGITRTDGWEFSSQEGNVVTSNKGHNQAIFLTDEYSDRYIFSVDMQIDHGLKGIDGSDGIFRGGVCTMSAGERDFTTVLIQGTDLKNNVLKMYRLKYKGWKYSDIVSRSISPDYNYEESNHTVNIKVIKDGPNFYYFVEGEFVYFNREDDLAGKCCPGVYTLTSVATFSNPEFTDYSDTPEELRSELRKYVYRIDVSTGISGGSVAVDKSSLDKNTENPSVNITIKPNNGYVLNSFTINGNDEFDYVVKNIKNGVVNLPVTEDVEIDARFIRFSRDNDVIKIRGEVVSEDGKEYLSGLKVQAYDTSNPMFCYDLETNSQGRVELSFLNPKVGTYLIGDKAYNVGSEYSVIVYFENGYLPVSVRFKASDADENGIITGKFVPKEKLDIIGKPSSSQVFNQDGSYTIAADSVEISGLLMQSSKINGNNWTAEVNVKTSEISQWNMYGIMIKYDSGNYVLLGASQRNAQKLAIASRYLKASNGETKFVGEFASTNDLAITDVRNNYLSKDKLNVKVTYYEGQYYVYLNDVIYRVFSASEIGASSYGTPVQVGFGYRLDDSLPQTATFSDWTYCIEGDANFKNPTEDVKNILTNVGGVPTSQVINNDGSYTATATANVSGGMLMNSSDIAGKNWTAEVNVKTKPISQWNTYGIAIKYDTGKYLILGASQRGNSLLRVGSLPNGVWKIEYKPTNELAITTVRNNYLSKDNLNVKVTYYGGQYYVYFNDVLYKVFSASELGVDDTYGNPVSVGFGYRLDSGSRTGTFSDWTYCIEGDANFRNPTEDAKRMQLTTVGGVPTSQVINEDGSYTATAQQGMSGGLLMNSSDIADKSWIAEVNVKTDTISQWNIYGIAIKYGDGNYLILGASQRTNSLLRVAARVGDTWIGEFSDNSDAITAERGVYLSKAYLNVKVLYQDGNYSVYLNDVLFAKLSASTLGVDTYGNPVSVGFGYRLDSGLPQTATFSDWTYCVAGDAKYSEFLSSHQS